MTTRAAVQPVRETAKVLSNRKVGAYAELVLVAPRIARGVRAGQFVEIQTAPPGTFMLRRPFSVSEADRSPGSGTITIVFEVIGPGTTALAAARVHDHVDVIGPLGQPFGLPPESASCILVGGGYGAAPMFLLAAELRARRSRVDMVLGAATASRLFRAMEAKRVSGSLTVTTDDGSSGTRGVVTDALPPLLARAREAPGGARIYACGPMPMLAAVSRVAAEHEVPCQVAVEERMACGTGICFSCVVPVGDATGEGTRMARACTEGPVFDGAAIAWHELGHPALPAASGPPEQELVVP